VIVTVETSRYGHAGVGVGWHLAVGLEQEGRFCSRDQRRPATGNHDGDHQVSVDDYHIQEGTCPSQT
jgi:hypothetical protein